MSQSGEDGWDFHGKSGAGSVVPAEWDGKRVLAFPVAALCTLALGKGRAGAYASPMHPFVVRWLVISLVVGLVLTTMGSSGSGLVAITGAALLLGLANALIRPLTLRLTRVGLVVVTILAVYGVNILFFRGLGSSIPPYQFPSTEAALGGAAVVFLVSWPFNFFFRSSDGHVHAVTHHEEPAAPVASRE